MYFCKNEFIFSINGTLLYRQAGNSRFQQAAKNEFYNLCS